MQALERTNTNMNMNMNMNTNMNTNGTSFPPVSLEEAAAAVPVRAQPRRGVLNGVGAFPCWEAKLLFYTLRRGGDGEDVEDFARRNVLLLARLRRSPTDKLTKKMERW